MTDQQTNGPEAPQRAHSPGLAWRRHGSFCEYGCGVAAQDVMKAEGYGLTSWAAGFLAWFRSRSTRDVGEAEVRQNQG